MPFKCFEGDTLTLKYISISLDKRSGHALAVVVSACVYSWHHQIRVLVYGMQASFATL